MATNLYEKDLFINPAIPFLFNKNITEYDMKNAGFSLIKEFKLLSDSDIDKLDKLPKDKQKVKIGILRRDNKDFSKALSVSFKLAREEFFKENDLNDNDIISIKKDAIFTCKNCSKQKIGSYIDFRDKNHYTSYIHLNNKIEVYYSLNQIDIKGLSKKNIELHKDEMVSLISEFCRRMETQSNEKVLSWFKQFIDKYKKREVNEGYYRTFNADSGFMLDNENKVFDISYNYYNVLLKLVQIPL